MLTVVVVAGLFAFSVVYPGPENLDTESLETQINANINDARQAEGLPQLSHSDRLSDQASSYSQEMAINDFYGHDSPVSGPMRSRLACEPAGENINSAYYVEDFEGASGKEHFLENETQVANYIVDSWLRSSSHRQNIMDSRFTTHGIGVNVSETDEGTFVIVTQQLCG
jgi:uncharacterized protein YkwD